MRITRCPRCRANDMAADAHPARVLDNGMELRAFVCRDCYRPTELEFRIACDGAGVPYRDLPIRDALRGLRDFYLTRLEEWNDPALLMEEPDRVAASAPIRAALDDIERRLAIAALP